ncbi:MAG TPA: hypothetical protein VH352_10630 [Pseudonocardiaceae bacterium]|nr:hypothetical protein [Pseudonocardiaceae bacterium]
MSRTMVIRYETKAEAADENARLVAAVFAQLAADDPGGIRYATFRLADGVSFVHVVVHDGDSDPLSRSSAFADFQAGIGDRVVGPPVPSEATLVGSYRFLTD